MTQFASKLIERQRLCVTVPPFRIFHPFSLSFRIVNEDRIAKEEEEKE